MIVVRVPASTANLGPGFDALGMALTAYAEITVDGRNESGPVVEQRSERQLVDPRHPADVAFRSAGGQGAVAVRSPIPVGRGLGFSGAMRVGGLVAAHAQRGLTPEQLSAERSGILAAALALEGHADNAAASLYGGVVATAGGRVARVPLAFDAAVVVWVPKAVTSTQRSRASLPSTVSFAEAAFNVGRTALLVAALASGDIDALRTATEDRLHQDARFAANVASRSALAIGLEAGAWAGWLSGSGPSVALLVAPDGADPLADDLAGALEDGHAKVLHIDPDGATVRDSGARELDAVS